jgi:hypothetical protein
VRPGLSGVDRAARAGSPAARTPGIPERPPSPKKRKASFSIDKEFILKDDKVKRNTGRAAGVQGATKVLVSQVCIALGLDVQGWEAPICADAQGDISQARGQLGQLLFEFSQIELNRDLLEAIKRTESKTGWQPQRPVHPASGPCVAHKTLLGRGVLSHWLA